MAVAYESGSSEVVMRVDGSVGGWIGVDDSVCFYKCTVRL
jgi:hypothetical protein